MYTDGLREPSRLEEEYFYKKDRELIEKMKAAEQQKQDLLERTKHYHKCSTCGLGMHEKHGEVFSLLFCKNCESIHLNLNNLEGLGQNGQLKLMVNELRDLLKNTKKSA